MTYDEFLYFRWMSWAILIMVTVCCLCSIVAIVMGVIVHRNKLAVLETHNKIQEGTRETLHDIRDVLVRFSALTEFIKFKERIMASTSQKIGDAAEKTTVAAEKTTKAADRIETSVTNDSHFSLPVSKPPVGET